MVTLPPDSYVIFKNVALSSLLRLIIVRFILKNSILNFVGFRRRRLLIRGQMQKQIHIFFLSAYVNMFSLKSGLNTQIQ